MTTLAAVVTLLAVWMTSFVCGQAPGPCDQCRFEHGVGYMPAPLDCSKFLQCRLSAEGRPEVAATMSCPPGQYWNQALLTCDYAAKVYCPNDHCSGSSQNQPFLGSCRQFWNCSTPNGVPQLCPPGNGFSTATHTCVVDSNCDPCNTPPPVVVTCPNLRSVPSNPSQYQELVNEQWLTRACAPGTTFTLPSCGCDGFAPTTGVPGCTPLLNRTFTDATENSQIQVDNYNVVIRNGEAIFGSNSKMLINYFSNVFWGSTIYISLKFRLQNAPTGPVCLLSNGDCNDTASIAIRATTTGVEFFVDTENSPPVSFIASYNGSPNQVDQTVTFTLANNTLTGTVGHTSQHQRAVGNIETRHCGLVLGDGTGCHKFLGTVDFLTIYKCVPTQ